MSCLGNDLQQNPAPIHLQHVNGGDDVGADQQPGCYRNQPAHVVPLPLPQPVGHARAGKISHILKHIWICFTPINSFSSQVFLFLCRL